MAKFWIRDHTRRSWQLCQHLYWLTHWLNLEPIGVERTAADLGTIWHSMMDAWWSPKIELFRQPRIEAAREALYAAMPEGFSALREYLPMLEDMLMRYDALWSAEGTGGEVFATEDEIAAPLRLSNGRASTGVELRGRVDKIVVDEHGEVWIVDHKTKGVSGSLDSLAAELGQSLQAVGYAILAEHAYGRRPAGVIFDMAMRCESLKPGDWPVIKSGARLSMVAPARATKEFLIQEVRGNDFALSEYVELLDRLPSEATNHQYFRRKVVRFDAAEIDRSRHELHAVALEMRRATSGIEGADAKLQSALERFDPLGVYDVLSLGERRFPRSPGACMKWGKICEMADLCRYQSVEALTSYKHKEER